MAKKYARRHKYTKLKKLSHSMLLIKFIVLTTAMYSVFLMVAIISFHPSDPSWLQNNYDVSVKNLTGSIGAWSADLFFFIFGILAYIIPLSILFMCWNILKNINDFNGLKFFVFSLRLTIWLILIITSSILMEINIKNLPNFSSGGFIGSVFSKIILSHLNTLETTILLFFIWIISFRLFTGCSWISIIKNIYKLALVIKTFIINCFRFFYNQNKYQARKAYTFINLVKFNDNISNITDCINYNDALYSTLLIKRLSKENLIDNKNYIKSVIFFRIKKIFNIPIEQLKRYYKIIFSKLLNIIIPLGSKICCNKNINCNYFIKTNNQKKTINKTIPLISLIVRRNNEVNTNTFLPSAKIQVKKYSDMEFFCLNPICLFISCKYYNNLLIILEKNKLDVYKNSNIYFIVQFYDYELNINDYSDDNLYELFFQQKKINNDTNQINTTDQSISSINVNHKNLTVDKVKTNISINKIDSKTVCIDDNWLATREKIISQKKIMKNIKQMSLTSKYNEEKLKQIFSNHKEFCNFSLKHKNQFLSKLSTSIPSLNLLAKPEDKNQSIDVIMLQKTSNLIEKHLDEYRIKVKVVGFSSGPVVTRFELNLAPGVKVAHISNLSRDLARFLLVTKVRIVDVIPGKPYVGLELPNKKRQTVYLRELLNCNEFRYSSSPLTIVLGKDVEGKPVIADLQKMPHLLVAGTTGSGKSVSINTMILSILYKAHPEDVRFIMIDPKILELSIYEGIPHLLTKIVTNIKDATKILHWCVNEMERRYKLMSILLVRDLISYNRKINNAEHMGVSIPNPFWTSSTMDNNNHSVLKKEPYIVIIIDEFSDLMMISRKKNEELIVRLTQKARASGIHLILATQRPSVNIVTGLIKANIATRIAFTVSSKTDSRIILDQSGAESLLGVGDMLYLSSNSSVPTRVHGAFVSDQEVYNVVKDWQSKR